jgi:hypothetical protein
MLVPPARTADLSAYVKAGYFVSKGPDFYLEPQNIPHGDMCRMRGGLSPIPVTEMKDEGVFRWELSERQTGVVDIVWDVAVVSAASVVAGSVEVGDRHVGT